MDQNVPIEIDLHPLVMSQSERPIGVDEIFAQQ
jgi:hypothetical protein